MEHHGAQDGKRCASLRFAKERSASMARRFPKMGRHSSGQARITLAGKVHYLGVFGSPEAHERYAELVRSVEGGGPPQPRVPTAAQVTSRVRDLCDRYAAYVDEVGLYTKWGLATSQRALVFGVLGSLRDYAGDVPVGKFSEALLVTWRDRLLQNRTVTRGTINRKVGIALQVFRWGKLRGMVPKPVWTDVAGMEPLRRGECGPRREHGRPRRAPSFDEIETVAHACCAQVGDMLRLQALLGCRPGEICRLRMVDVDKAPVPGDNLGCWTWTVPEPKVDHHGIQVRYFIPPAAQRILSRYVVLPKAHVFSPARAMADRRQLLREGRQTAPTKQMRDRDLLPPRDYADRWEVAAYRRHVHRACKQAGVANFGPNEVRHAAITFAANQVGLTAAAAMANHARTSTTSGYVHQRPEDALAVAAAVEARVATG